MSYVAVQFLLNSLYVYRYFIVILDMLTVHENLEINVNKIVDLFLSKLTVNLLLLVHTRAYKTELLASIITIQTAVFTWLVRQQKGLLNFQKILKGHKCQMLTTWNVL